LNLKREYKTGKSAELLEKEENVRRTVTKKEVTELKDKKPLG